MQKREKATATGTQPASMPARKDRPFIFMKRPALIGFTTFLVLALLFSSFIYQRYTNIREQQKEKALAVANNIRARLQETLANSLSATKTLSFFIQQDGSVSHFDSIAPQILEANINIDAVQMVPDGVIRYIYPLKGNEKAIGYNILEDPAREKEAFKAIEKNKLFFAGPLLLKQGGMAVVGRLPVFRNDKFWGFTAVVIKMSTLLKAAGIDSTGESGYYYQLSKINPETKKEEYFISHGTNIAGSYPVSVFVPAGEWKLSVMPGSTYKVYRDIILLAILGLLLAILGGIFVFKESGRPEQLNALIKKRTRELKESKENYKVLFEKSPLPLWIYDLATLKVIEVNDAAISLYGYTREEFLGIDLRTIRPGSDIDAFVEISQKGTDELRESGVWTHIKKDGEAIQVMIFSRNIHYMNQKGRLVLLMDVSEKTRIENELKKSEEKYRLLIEQASDGIILYSFDGTIHSFNKAAYIQSGYTREEFEQLNLSDLFFESGVVKNRSKDNKINTEESATIYRKLKKKDGTAFIVELNTRMLPDGKIIAIVRDITEREKSEKIIRESEERYRTIIEQASDGIFIAAENGSITDVNSAGCKMLGYTREELFASNYMDMIPAEDLLVNPVQITTVKTGKGVINERRLIKKDGTLINVEISATKLPDGRFQSIIRDITERKKDEKALEESFSLLEATLESTADGIMVADSNGRITRFNKKFAQLWRIPGDILDAKDDDRALAYVLDQLKYPDNFLAKVKELYDHPDAVSFDILEFKDGRAFERYSQPQVINGRSVGRVWSFRDITERKKAGEELFLSEQKYRLLFHNNPLPMWMATIPGLDIIDVNDAAIKQYGYTREEFLELNTKQMRPAEDVDNFVKEVNKMLPNTTNIRNWRHKKKDGTVIEVETYSHQIMYEGRLVWLGLSHDVTEKNMARELLQHSYEEIRQLASNLQNIREEERTNIAREIHDELGQQLTGLKMDMHWLARRLKNADAAVTHKMNESIEVINATIVSVRKIATDLRPSILDDLGLVTALEWHSEQFEKRSGIKVKFINKTYNLLVDPRVATALFRIYQEVLTNVARHANAKLVTATLQADEKELSFSIADNGVGFNLDTIGKKSTLGLLGIKERSLLIGGTYDIKSKPGEGSEVLIVVPLTTLQAGS